MTRKMLSIAALMAAAVMSGCAAQGAYVVRYGPPPPRYGVVGVAPGPGFVWTDGYWDWRGSNWFWVSGRWVRPPHARAVWVRPEWRHEGNGWRFHRGYWRR